MQVNQKLTKQPSLTPKFEKRNINDDMTLIIDENTSASSHRQDIENEIREVMGSAESQSEPSCEEIKDIEAEIEEVMGEDQISEETKEAETEHAEDFCTICFTSELNSEPTVELTCGHTFHANCVKQLFEHKWSTLRISFDFMACPVCKHPIDQIPHCEPIQEEIEKNQQLKA